VTDQVQALHHGLGDFETGGIDLLDQQRFNREAGLGDRPADQGQRFVKRDEWLSRPIAANGAKEPLLDRVAFGGSGWVMTDADCQAESVSQQRLKRLFPQAEAVTMATASIAQDEQALGHRKGMATEGLPPSRKLFDGKLRRIGILTAIDIAPVVRQVLHALEPRFAQRVLLKIMGSDFMRRLTAAPTWILERAKPLFFLGIETADGQARLTKRLFVLLKVGKLRLPIGMG